MKTFKLSLLDAAVSQDFDAVVQFIGADDNGSFGILAGHVACVVLLRYGLARFCDANGVWHYLAIPGGILRFADQTLTITTVRYFLGDDSSKLSEQLAAEMAHTDSEIHTARATLDEIERSLVRRLTQLSQNMPGGNVL